MSKECCGNCRLNLELKLNDYSDMQNQGVVHRDYDGFVCLAFAFEGIATHMLGINPEEGMCEMYSPKGDLNNEPTIKLTNQEWIGFLADQFNISRTSAKEMLHCMMQVKKEDNFKKQFNKK